jgi:hypothetical protein
MPRDVVRGTRVRLDDSTTGVVMSVWENGVVGVVLDESATIVFVPRENCTPEGLRQLTHNIHAAMQRRHVAQARFAFLGRRDASSTRRQQRVRRGSSRERRPRRTRRVARTCGSRGDPDPEPEPDLEPLPGGAS